jgi:hypothetical protein
VPHITSEQHRIAEPSTADEFFRSLTLFTVTHDEASNLWVARAQSIYGINQKFEAILRPE